MNKSKVRKSLELDELIDSVYDIYVKTNKKDKFRDFIKGFSEYYFDNEYLGPKIFAETGLNLKQAAQKTKKPVYLVFCSRQNMYIFCVESFNKIKRILINEKVALNNRIALANVMKSIDALDAAILAYIVLSSNATKNQNALKFLSKKALSLGQCLAGEKRKYSKSVVNTAKLYRSWAWYKKSASSSAEDLNVSSLVH